MVPDDSEEAGGRVRDVKRVEEGRGCRMVAKRWVVDGVDDGKRGECGKGAYKK